MKAKQLFATAIFAGAALMSTAGVSAKTYKVDVSQIVEHPALDATRNGLIDGLKAKGYEQGKNLDLVYKTAQGNPAIASQIARQFVGEGADVLVGIATPSAQALAATTKNIPIVFTAVTDPVEAKLVKSLDNPTGNVTGLSDLSPVGQHVELMQEFNPDLKSIGVVYNPGEANSVALMTLLKAEAAKRNIQVNESTALKSADIRSATQAIVAKSDVIYAMIDNTVASAIDGMVAAANQAKKPVFAASTTYIESGAVIGLGADYYQVGIQTADYVAAILEGKKPTDLPVTIAKASDLIINKQAAEDLGITIPKSILDRAEVSK
ncbi:ABC transporter substrate-binding protein [Vibrio rumoiensis]|uniref:ABC transporter substrate-binding protein n=1 Tax=Vibrio rumoiensis 1S-45 TaxID=1188252 RepID=A0A1E5E3N2_9VIBR|nr:ABC transporter substrate-binding protein [Vibrio rumoiensis]OEF26955.1 ABC transporter substrate-binding protein [Vibrio rumoiensis 1S-45]